MAVRFSGDKVAEAAFEAEGASTAIAAGKALTRMVQGADWRRAAAVSTAGVEAAMAGGGRGGAARCPPGRAARFAVDALHAAFEDALRRGRFPEAAREDDTVLVAMSGGVDSSVACLKVRESGRQAIGITMRLWSDPVCDDGAASCCSPEAIIEAREVCHQLGLPHLTVDFSREFEQEVVEYFVSAYFDGRTPNPCVFCNGRFRFPRLNGLAGRLGARRIATGHYARIVEQDTGHGSRLALARGADRRKDQSYMLWGIGSSLLGRIEFPLGTMEKSETRRLAREKGLRIHERPESQDVCFIPDNDYRRFLRSRIDSFPGGGDIIDSAGEVIGAHGCYFDYTVGQRRGLGISSRETLYVTGTDPERNTVIVGTRDELAVRRLGIGEVNAFFPPEDIREVRVQVRYNSVPVGATVSWRGSGDGLTGEVMLDKQVLGVAPGQSAVLYIGDVVAAAGVITATGK